jgi:Mlc titration factor MtfA (ptsG expression regulator)
VVFSLITRWKRRRLAARAFPDAWRPIVDDRLDFAASMDTEERERFETHLKLFAWRLNWEPAGGLDEVTDEMRVVIAGAAARLARNLPYSVYDHLSSIVVYPSHYKHEARDGIIFGEANRWGTVVLSWDAVEHGIDNPFDGHDTALHELAHVLDVGDGAFDGTPLLEGGGYRAWAEVFSRHYLALKRHAPRRSVLRKYGATNEAEFFAVATEAFFEKPRQMKKKAPDLYDALADYYEIDP